MHLVHPSEVLDRLKLPDDSQLEALILSSLEGTTTFIESVLNTDTIRGSHTDIFKIDSSVNPQYSGLFKLRLANGFVQASPAITVRVTEESPLAVETPTWTSLESWAFPRDLEKGYIYLDESYDKNFVEVVYTAGFDGPDDVPRWLVEASMAYAIKLMSVQRLGDDKPQLDGIYSMLDKHRVMTLDRHMRSSSRATTPLYSL